MKKYLSRIVPVFLMLWVFLCVHSLLLTEAPAQQDRNIGYLENVHFEKLDNPFGQR